MTAANQFNYKQSEC